MFLIFTIYTFWSFQRISFARLVCLGFTRKGGFFLGSRPDSKMIVASHLRNYLFWVFFYRSEHKC